MINIGKQIAIFWRSKITHKQTGKGNNTMGEQKKHGCIYVNRELSWLKFNERVLTEAKRRDVPLCERFSFLSIYQSNLDEFFMVRVGSLEDQKLLSGDQRENKTKMTPEQQIDAILLRVNKLNRDKDAIYTDLMKEAEAYGIRVVSFKEIPKPQRLRLKEYFFQEVLPLLSVMIVGRKQPFPFLKGQEIYAMAILDKKKGKEKIGIIPCDSMMIPRMIEIPGMTNTYILREDWCFII